MPAIETFMPIVGETFDSANGKSENRQLGLVTMLQPIDQSFVDHLSRLTDTDINVFSTRGLTSGAIPAYRNLDWGSDQDAPESRAKRIKSNEVTIDGTSFYQRLIPLFAGQKLIGTIAVLHSKALVRENTWQLIRIFVLIAMASLLFILPLAWYLSASIVLPLSVLSRIFRDVASGSPTGTLSDEMDFLEKEKMRPDELGDLTQSFIAMNNAINQKIRQINEINASLEEKVATRTAALRVAATAFDSQESLLITDADGVIVRVNKAFTESTGYLPEEAIGKTPRLLKSNRHASEFYHVLWDTLLRTGTWQGEIWNRRKNGEVFPKWLTISAVKGDDGMITHFVGSHIDITERKAADEEIKQLAFYDQLTQLPNRRLLLDRLAQALTSSTRSGKRGALMILDLDNFKSLNDTHGHDAGDRLLIEVAQRIVASVRPEDTVSRLGGDEYVVMVEDLDTDETFAANQAEMIAEKIRTALNQPYALYRGGQEHHSTPSIGVTLFRGNEPPVDIILKQADMALYQAKTAGRNTVRFFNPAMQAAIESRSRMEAALRKGLQHGEFQIFYQPKVDQKRRACGAEALLRWMSADQGRVSPVDFIPIAESTGLIIPLGLWVMQTACAQLKAWSESPATRDLHISINVSARQFHQPNFVGQVFDSLIQSGANPKLLKLELTESVVLENVEDVITRMQQIRALGVMF